MYITISPKMATHNREIPEKIQKFKLVKVDKVYFKCFSMHYYDIFDYIRLQITIFYKSSHIEIFQINTGL